MRVELNLTQRQAEAVLRSDGLSAGHGIRRSLALQEANMRIRHAIINASQERAAAPSDASSVDDLSVLGLQGEGL